MDNLKLIELHQVHDDVAIDVTDYLPNLFDQGGKGGLLTIYEDVKLLAIDFVKQKVRPNNFLVEMVRNKDGFPTALTWHDGKLISKVGVLDGSKEGEEEDRLGEARLFL